MRDLWAFIGGVAVGIMVATGVFAREDDEKLRFVEHDEDELEDRIEEEGVMARD